MEDITRDTDDLDDTDAWMWSFDDDVASRDVTKKARQFFFSIYLTPRFLVDNALLLLHKDYHDTCSSNPRRVGIIVSLTIALRRAVKRVYVKAKRGNRAYSDGQHRGQG